MTRNAGSAPLPLRLALAAALCLAAVLPLLLSPAQAQNGSAPAKPKGLSATASHDQVVLTWDDPQDDSITGYVILRRNRETTVSGQFSDLVPDTGSAATTYTDNNVAADTPYTYRIKAINEHGLSERSRWFRIDTPAAPTPVAPTGLTSEVSHDSVTLTWDTPDDDSITGYVILRRDKEVHQEGTFKTVEKDTRSADATYTDDTVKPDKQYVYRIRAINEHGLSEISGWVRACTPVAPGTGQARSLNPPGSDPAAPFASTATYAIRFQGAWTVAVTPDGLPSDAHFSRLIGGVHDVGVTFLESGQPASAGVESMAEEGGWTGLRDEVQNAGTNALSVLSGGTDVIGPTTSETLTAELASAHPRVTLTTMVAPSHDWFVGVSGLPLLDAEGLWLRAHSVDLYPWDAGTEQGEDFALEPSNETIPRGVITSIRGTGKFTTEALASLSFTLQSVSTMRSVPENTAAGEDIGAPGAATSSSGAVSYTLGRTDAASFDLEASTGQLRTKSPLDHETKSRGTAKPHAAHRYS